MFSDPAAAPSVRAPAVPAITAANAAATTRSTAPRFFRPSIFSSREKDVCDRSSLWQRNHIAAGSVNALLDAGRLDLSDAEPRPPRPEAGVRAGDHLAHAPVDVV